MAHTHDHSNHTHGPVSYTWAFAIAVSVNLLFTLIEAAYAVLAHSTSLLADAGHNLGDVAGLALAWGANWLLQRNSSEKYSYGYKKTTILAALANALLLVLASGFIAQEAINRFIHPVAVNELTVIYVALAGILINGSTALLFMQGKHDLNIKGAYLHLLADALVSVGVVVAGLLIYYTGWLWLDPLAGLIIVVTILLSTWGLMRDSVNMVLAGVPHGINIQAVKEYLLGLPGVENVHDLHIWNLSTQEIALTAHLVMPNKALLDADHQHINTMLQQHFHIHHITLQVEQGAIDNPCGQADVC